jgi:glycosyltransferase involved in cell wall biosynthesis
MNVLVVTNMYPTPAMPAFGTFVQDQVEALRAAGLAVDVFFVNGRESKVNYARAFPRLWRVLAGKRYDLIHAHYVLAGIVARAQWRYPVVLTHHGGEVLGHPRWQGWLSRLVTPLFDEVVYVSEELRRALRDRDGWVIPCGVNFDDFRPEPRSAARAALGLPTDRRLVLWAGEPWRPEKQFHLVERAMAIVRSHLPDADLIVLQKKPHAVVPAYMSACDALVLTSAVEGSPMVVKEAMACNLPVVSVPVGDVPDVVEDTEGCALTTWDPSDIAAALVSVLRDQRRTNGRVRMDRYRHDHIARRLVDVYRQAAGERGEPGQAQDLNRLGQAVRPSSAGSRP